MSILTDLKADVVEMFGLDESVVKIAFAQRAVNWVKSEIDSKGFSLTTYNSNKWKDTYYILYEAALWMLCEFLANQNILAYRPAEVSEEQLGRLRLQYAASQPKFFFFGKTVEVISYERLITHETFRMLAASMISKFYHDYMRGNIRKYGAVMQSSVSRDSTKYWT